MRWVERQQGGARSGKKPFERHMGGEGRHITPRDSERFAAEAFSAAFSAAAAAADTMLLARPANDARIVESCWES